MNGLLLRKSKRGKEGEKRMEWNRREEVTACISCAVHACMHVRSFRKKKEEEEKQGKEMQAKRRKVTFNCDLGSYPSVKLTHYVSKQYYFDPEESRSSLRHTCRSNHRYCRRRLLFSVRRD